MVPATVKILYQCSSILFLKTETPFQPTLLNFSVRDRDILEENSEEISSVALLSPACYGLIPMARF